MEFTAGDDGVIDLSKQLRCISHLMATIRNRETDHTNFAIHAKRLMTLICEESIARVNPQQSEIVTPTDTKYMGIDANQSQIVGVSVIRAGDSMLDVFLNISPESSAGKILIQRDEATALPVLFYSKVPPLAGKSIILLDPMLATGGSAVMAIQICVEKGADLSKMIFACVLAAPEGIANVQQHFPSLKIVTGEVDQGLNEKKYIIPGLGDFGDRFYGTV